MFRGARRSDLEQILEIYAHARKAMEDSGNPTQWGDSYPPQEMLLEKNGFARCGIIHVEDGTPRVAYQKLSATVHMQEE